MITHPPLINDRYLTVDVGSRDFAIHFLNKWTKCHRCPLHESTRTRPIIRGFIPARILFVGEAPGESEDTLGAPFIGPAGKLLDHIIKEGMGDRPYLITNCVVCTPPRINGKIIEPRPEYKRVCSPHIKELVSSLSIQLVIALGTHAHKSLDWVSHIHLIHPAAIIRYPSRKMDIAAKECIYAIQAALKGLG